MGSNPLVLIVIATIICLNLSETNGERAIPVLKRIITSPLVPSPPLPFSQAVQVGNTIWLSGWIGVKFNGELEEGIANQTRLTLEYFGHILKAAYSDYKNVIQTTVILADINDVEEMNEVYREFFLENFPARVVFEAAKLPENALVEISGVAISGKLVDY